MPVEIIDIETLHHGWSRLLKLRIRQPDGPIIERELEDHGAAVAVLPYDPERRIAILVRQLRAPVFYAAGQDTVLEAIAGLLEEDDPAECARREATEEAGLRLEQLERVTTAWTMPGISTERMHLYFAVYRSEGRRGAANEYRGGEGELTTVVEVPLADLARQADAGELTDLKTLFLVQTLRLRQPTLFSS